MTEVTVERIFDGHNDVLSRLWDAPTEAVTHFFDGEKAGHIDLPRARAGGLAGGLCAVYVPSPAKDAVGDGLPPDANEAVARTFGMAGLLRRLERAGGGRLWICRAVADIRAAVAEEAFAAVLHLEGAEAIGPDLDTLYMLHALGLRSLGPVWSRPNVFASGVPFRFPSSPDIGPGLTGVGKDLVRVCNELRIVVDLSHMNEQGFWDIAGLTTAPLVATHSNVHALCPHSRNLTDRQIDAIAASNGLIGINYGALFLRDDGTRDSDTALDRVVDHVDYIAKRVGVAHVGFGSDFDGTTIPTALGDAAGLPNLVAALKARGYEGEALTAICRDNWLRVLGETWGG